MLHDGDILNIWERGVLLKGEACLLENWQGVHVCSESNNWFPLPNDAYDTRLGCRMPTEMTLRHY